MPSELITLYGATSGGATTGTLTLATDLAQNTFAYVRIPQGLNAKIFGYRIAGPNQTQIAVQYSLDVHTATPSSPFTLDLPDLASAGSLDLEKRRPIILRSETGTEGFLFTWTQGTQAVVGVSIDLEFGGEDLFDQRA